MRLMLDTSGVTFMVTLAPVPKTDQEGKQQFTKPSESRPAQPMWQTQVMALDSDTGGQVVRITTAGEMPAVKVGQPVVPVQVEAIPWMNNGRHGVAYRASELKAAPPNGNGSK